MKPEKEHVLRVKKELVKAGVTSYGLMKSTARHLPTYIHEQEHIGGVVYGQYDGGSGMLVATDYRIIFLDHKPLFSTSDELTYDVVAGVKVSRGGIFNAVTLHTRIADYTIRYVNSKCARTFVGFIKSMRLEKTNLQERKSVEKNPSKVVKPHGKTLTMQPTQMIENQTTMPKTYPISTDILAFLRSHDLGVLSTLDRTGNIHGTPVYYVVGEMGELFIVTKQATAKARNIQAQGSVGFTVFDAEAVQTLHAQADAEFETDQTVKDQVYSQIVKPRTYGGETRLPPITHIDGGAYTVIRLHLNDVKYADYSATHNQPARI